MRTSRVSLLLLPVIALACGGGGDSGDGAPAPEPERRFLSVGTAPPGGAFFVVGGALAEVLGAAQADAGWQVTAEATKGTQENIRRLQSGELDLALANASIAYFAVRGEGGWDKAYDVRAVMTLAPNVALFLTPESSDVESIADLAGKRAVIGPAGAGFHYFVRPILEAHGVAWADVTVLHNTQAGAVDMLADGSADAAFLGGAVPTASITQASTTGSVRFVPFDAAVRDQLAADYPFFSPAKIPAGTYRGQEQEFLGLNVGSMILVTAASADEETVYQSTRALWENRAKVVEKHPAGKAINERNAARDTGVPFHPGAVRFYTEIGLLSP